MRHIYNKKNNIKEEHLLPSVSVDKVNLTTTSNICKNEPSAALMDRLIKGEKVKMSKKEMRELNKSFAVAVQRRKQTKRIFHCPALPLNFLNFYGMIIRYENYFHNC